MWNEADAKEKAKIARVATQAIEKATDEAEERAWATVRVRVNTTNNAVEEAATDIRSGAEEEGAERERSEAEARAWSKAEIREETERKRAEAGANTKAETEAVERVGAWSEAKAK